MSIIKTIKDGAKKHFEKSVLDPVNNMVDENLSDITTTIGSFIIRSVRGKFQRSITFDVGAKYGDAWMEEALYGILYKYNNIKSMSRLRISNPKGVYDGTGMYFTLDDGVHNLKYRDYNILLAIQTVVNTAPMSRSPGHRQYTVITYDLSPEFVKNFEKDMLTCRNSLLRIRSDSSIVNVYQDGHESDGYTYWELIQKIPKRPLSTIYLPYEIKKQIVDTVNEFFANKEYYRKHGIAHNLKILLYGLPAGGKDSIAKMIASEWNRNIFYVTGGKGGKFIPNAICDQPTEISSPLFLVSDIDKYPFLINEPDINLDAEDAKEEKMNFKQCFGNMINALDGVMSGEDSIIIMTTNHIEKFSEVFLRPGRVDLKLEIPLVVAEVFRKFVWDYYHVELPKDIKLIHDHITIADLQADVVFRKMDVGEFVSKYTK